jgi:hypothetical protein
VKLLAAVLSCFAIAMAVVVGGPVGEEVIYTPYDGVRFALADAVRLSSDRQLYARYLWVGHLPKAERKRWLATIAFDLNSLSNNKVLILPAFVEGSDDTVIRFFLDDYGIDAFAYGRLVARGSGPVPAPEPYFRTQFVLLIDHEDYQEYDYGTQRWLWKRREIQPYQIKKSGSPPWITAPDNGKAITSLIAVTQSQYPIIRADWFNANAMIAPAYYDLLGLGDRAEDFERLVLADEKKARKARVDLKGVVVFSGVALHNRTLTRIPTIATALGGYYWETHDTLKSIDDRDYVNVLLDEKFDATEVIATLRNGLQAYDLTDGSGKRLDVANAAIAVDGETKLADKQVYSARNCITCHSAGIRPFEDEVRALSRTEIALLVSDKRQARRVSDLYFSLDFGPVVAFDQSIYAASVKACTGLSAAENASQFERFTIGYIDQPVTPEMAAAEAGVAPNVLIGKLQRAGNIDHTLAGFLRKPVRPARRDQFEKSFGQMMEVLRIVP